MRVILDTYNNNTRIHIIKLQSHTTAGGGRKILSRRKQTNKKNKKGQKDVWHGNSMKCEARHATRGMKPRSTNCEADGLTTTPSRWGFILSDFFITTSMNFVENCLWNLCVTFSSESYQKTFKKWYLQLLCLALSI